MTILGTRALNRALLARQSLLRRQAGTALGMIEHLVGMQAQAPFPPYYGLWTRLRDFRPDELSRLLLDREVARIVVMRGTVHLVSAADALPLRALTQPIMDADLRGNTTFTPKLAGIDTDELAETVREVLSEAPLDTAALGRALARHHPHHDPKALVHAARNRLPLVQVPPRAVWGRSGRPTYATAESWLRNAPRREPDIDGVVLRYLAAFGPATVRDVQTWCGLTRLGEVIERLRPRVAYLPHRSGQGTVRPAGSAAARRRHTGTASVRAGIRQPAVLPRRPHPRAQRTGPQAHQHQERGRTGDVPRRRFRERPLEARALGAPRRAVPATVRRGHLGTRVGGQAAAAIRGQARR